MTLATEKEYDSGTEHVIICLKEQGFTTPLAHAVLQQSQQLFALRIWILDNSGSMNEADGRQLVATKKRTDVQWVKCTRFAELQECVYYHAQLNALLEAPTKFILLNPPSNGLSQYFGVGEMDLERIEEDLISLQKTLMNVCPRGVTPLTTHLRNIFHTIQGMEDSLRREGKMISIVLATDGLPSDESGSTTQFVRVEFERALRQLQQLPVWIVVRLCTNDESILAYYENLDSQLELSLEVLDDFEGEAKEVHRFNPWLTYSLVLHRCREMGFLNRLMDLLDERPFTMDEMISFMRLLLIGTEMTFPDPHADWADFMTCLRILCGSEEKQYNPMKRKSMPWIDFQELERIYGPQTIWEKYFRVAFIVAFGILLALLYANLIVPK